MANPKPIDNPEYTKLFFLIFNKINSPSLILKHIKRISPSNLSMKLQQLEKINFIKNKRIRYDGNSTSIYFINLEGLIEYIWNYMLKDYISKLESKFYVYK